MQTELLKILPVIGIILLSGCGVTGQAGEDAEIRSKLDEHLQVAVENPSSGPLNCFIILTNGPDAEILRELEETGLELVSITNEVLAVRGFAEDLKRAARYDYVEFITLRQMDSE
ncbi:MAG: hypothetical protein WD266_11415 [Balneolales bacterium]